MVERKLRCNWRWTAQWSFLLLAHAASDQVSNEVAASDGTLRVSQLIRAEPRSSRRGQRAFVIQPTNAIEDFVDPPFSPEGSQFTTSDDRDSHPLVLNLDLDVPKGGWQSAGEAADGGQSIVDSGIEDSTGDGDSSNDYTRSIPLSMPLSLPESVVNEAKKNGQAIKVNVILNMDQLKNDSLASGRADVAGKSTGAEQKTPSEPIVASLNQDELHRPGIDDSGHVDNTDELQPNKTSLVRVSKMNKTKANRTKTKRAKALRNTITEPPQDTSNYFDDAIVELSFVVQGPNASRLLDTHEVHKELRRVICARLVRLSADDSNVDIVRGKASHCRVTATDATNMSMSRLLGNGSKQHNTSILVTTEFHTSAVAADDLATHVQSAAFAPTIESDMIQSFSGLSFTTKLHVIDPDINVVKEVLPSSHTDVDMLTDGLPMVATDSVGRALRRFRLWLRRKALASMESTVMDDDEKAKLDHEVEMQIKIEDSESSSSHLMRMDKRVPEQLARVYAAWLRGLKRQGSTEPNIVPAYAGENGGDPEGEESDNGGDPEGEESEDPGEVLVLEANATDELEAERWFQSLEVHDHGKPKPQMQHSLKVPFAVVRAFADWLRGVTRRRLASASPEDANGETNVTDDHHHEYHHGHHQYHGPPINYHTHYHLDYRGPLPINKTLVIPSSEQLTRSGANKHAEKVSWPPQADSPEEVYPLPHQAPARSHSSNQQTHVIAGDVGVDIAFHSGKDSRNAHKPINLGPLSVGAFAKNSSEHAKLGEAGEDLWHENIYGHESAHDEDSDKKHVYAAEHHSYTRITWKDQKNYTQGELQDNENDEDYEDEGKAMYIPPPSSPDIFDAVDAARVSFRIKGVDYGKLSKQPEMETNFKTVVAEAIAIVASVSPSKVDISLSSGSVIVDAAVRGDNPAKLKMLLFKGRERLLQLGLSAVQGVPGIQSVASLDADGQAQQILVVDFLVPTIVAGDNSEGPDTTHGPRAKVPHEGDDDDDDDDDDGEEDDNDHNARGTAHSHAEHKLHQRKHKHHKHHKHTTTTTSTMRLTTEAPVKVEAAVSVKAPEEERNKTKVSIEVFKKVEGTDGVGSPIARAADNEIGLPVDKLVGEPGVDTPLP